MKGTSQYICLTTRTHLFRNHFGYFYDSHFNSAATFFTSPVRLSTTIIFMVFVNWTRMVWKISSKQKHYIQRTAPTTPMAMTPVAQIITNSKTIVKFSTTRAEKKIIWCTCVCHKYSKSQRKCEHKSQSERVDVLVKSDEAHYQQCRQYPTTIDSLSLSRCPFYSVTFQNGVLNNTHPFVFFWNIQ